MAMPASSQRLLRACRLVAAGMLLLQAGCGVFHRRYAGPSPGGANQVMPNPLVIPVTNPGFAWNQIVDTIDDYFDIASEQQVREIGGVLMEGRIVTKPLPGATIFEPFRRDSTHGFERWQSTFQSIRRIGFVRVIPVPNGFQVLVEVQKELEDVSHPENSTVGRSARRHDGSLIAFEGFDDQIGPTTLGWIPLGRDPTLEQEILQQLHARMFETATVPH